MSTASRPPFLPPPSAPPGIAPLLDEVMAAIRSLDNPERRITVVGALKSGKSSLLNALIGAAILPVRATRATGVVTVIRAGSPPSAAILRAGAGDEEPAPFDSIGRLILLGAGRRDEVAEIDEVRITLPLPLPLLAGGWLLVDTPGLAEDEWLSARVDREIERSDLVVMVLAADKILSARERETAARIHASLHGNIVFVVNRLDLVDEGDRAEILAWASRALTGTGNRLIGGPTIFATVATGDRSDIAAFGRWLADLLGGETGEQVARLSRLTAIERALLAAATTISMGLATARDTLAAARTAATAATAKERSEMTRRIMQAAAGIEAIRADLAALLDQFVAGCLTAAPPRPAAGSAIHLTFEAALRRYEREIRAKVTAAIAGLPAPEVAFDLSGWIVNVEIQAARDPAGEFGAKFGDLATRVFDGGAAGREAGEAAGAWIGKTVFGVDAEAETRKRIEGAARGLVPSLRRETDLYLDRIDAVLVEAGRFYEGWERQSPEVIAAEEEEQTHAELLRWSGEQLGVVREAIRLIDLSPFSS